MPAPALLLVALLLSPIHAFHWNESADARWAMGCSFPGQPIGYKIVPGENCSSACSAHSAPEPCTHFAHAYETQNCSFFHKPKVLLADAVTGQHRYDVCGVLWRTYVGRPSPRPRAEPEEKLWLWLGPVLGALATIIGAVLTLFWARHESSRRAPPQNEEKADDSMDNYSTSDHYDPPPYGMRVGF